MVAPSTSQSGGGGGVERKQSILPLFPLLSSHDESTRLSASYNLLSSLTFQNQNDTDTQYSLKRLLAGLSSSNESARQGFAVCLTQLLSQLKQQESSSPEQLKEVLIKFEESTNGNKNGLDHREERDLFFAKLVGSHAIIRSGILFTRPESSGGEDWKEIVGGLVSLGNKKTWLKEPTTWVICQAIQGLTQLGQESELRKDCLKWAVQRLVNDSREKAKGWGPDKLAIVLTLKSINTDTDFKTLLSPTFPSGSLLSRSSLPSLAQALRGALQSSENPFESSASHHPKQGSNSVKTSKNSSTPTPGQNPHFVWTLILESYFPTTDNNNNNDKVEVEVEEDERASFKDFWKFCIDESLFGSPSLPLKSLGFSLIQQTLPLLPPSKISTIFSGSSFLRVFSNHLRKSHHVGVQEVEKTLSKISEKLAFSLLPEYLSNYPEASLIVLKDLTNPPNSHPGCFENKFLEKLVSKLPLNGVRGWVNYLIKDLFLNPPSLLIEAPITVTKTQGEVEEDVEMQEEEDEKSLQLSKEKRLTAIRNWSLDQLLHVGRNGGVVKDEGVLKNLIEFLSVVGWFEIKKESEKGARSYVAEPRLSRSQRQASKSRFFSILTSLITTTTTTPSSSSNDKKSNSTIATSLGVSIWLSRAYQTLENLYKDSKHFSLASSSNDNNDDEDDDEDELVELKIRVKEMYELLGGKKEKNEKEAERRKFARSLIEGVLLVDWEEQDNNETKENGESIELLEQLCDVLPMLFPTLLASYKQEQDEDEEEEDEDSELPEPTTVLISLLLSLLQRPSAFVKAVSAHVVEGFAQEMGEQAVGLLLETIAPTPEEQEQEEEEGGGGSVADAEEEKKVKKGKKVEASEEDDQDDEENEDEEDSDSDSDGEVDEKFREELLKALEAGGLAPLNPGQDDDDSEAGDEQESEEELLDDEAMMELDDKLADIFRANGGGRKNKKRDRTDDLHYRLRLLDLLEVLARKRPSSPLLIPTFVPLLNLARSTAPLETELRNKASKLVRFLVQPRKPADSISPPTPDSALEALEELHALAQGVEISEFAPIVAQTAIALVKAALASPSADASTSAAVSTLFANSFEQYLATKNARTKVQPLLTTEFCKRAPAAAWGLFDRIVHLAKGQVEEGGGDKKATVNAFRRMQAFEVAQTLLVSYTNLKTPESTAAVLAGIPSYQSALQEALSTSLTSTPSAATFDASRLKQLVKNALSAARLTVQLSSQAQANKLWSVPEWISLVQAAKTNERFKGAVAVQTLIKQLVSVLGGTVVEEGGSGSGKKDNKKKDNKRKAPEVEDSTLIESKGKKVKATNEEDEEVGMNEVEVEVEMDEEEPVVKTGATPSKKDKKEKKKRRRSEGKA